MRFISSILAATLAVSGPSIAATTADQAAPVVLSTATPANVLRAGLQIPLTLAEPLTTEGKKLSIGQRVQLVTAEAVTLNGQTVIPVGSPATGEITDVRNKGMWGKSGRINGRVLYLRANGRQIRMTGQFDDKGVTGTAAVVASVIVLPVVGFFTTGTSARLPLGAPVTGFLDEDIEVAFAPDSAAQPMTVPVTAPK